jgi:hypothetical protein
MPCGQRDERDADPERVVYPTGDALGSSLAGSKRAFALWIGDSRFFTDAATLATR